MIDGLRTASKYVKVGDVTRRSNIHDTELFEIIEIIRHPNYKTSGVDDDIVLLKLDRDIEFNEFTRPICLPQHDEKPEKMIATGWGYVDNRKRQSDEMMKVTLELFDQAECATYYKNFRKAKRGIDYETKVCAGSHTESKDSCQGDSGKKIFSSINLARFDFF